MAFGKFRDKPDTQTTTTSSPVTKIDQVIKPISASKSGNSVAYVGSLASFIGTLKLDCTAEIGAYVEGQIESTGRLTILETGVIKGSIKAKDLIIKGKVQGNIFAENSLALCAPASIHGDITAPKLSIEAGVIFEGKCAMPEPKLEPIEPQVAAGTSSISAVSKN